MTASSRPEPTACLALGALLLSLTAPVAAQDASCPAPRTQPSAPTPSVDRETSDVVIDALRADLSQAGLSLISGDVVLERADQSLRTENLTLDHDQDRVVASGAVEFEDKDIHLEAVEARLDLSADTAELDQVRYELRQGLGRGKADTARLEGDSRSHLTEVTFTTCPAGNRDWQIRAREMTLDHDTGVGRGKGLALRFKGVPLLYLPWASFPIDDRRKSGFLVPSLGRSDDDGLDLAAPYYWNIAPNMDATLTPRFVAERGAMLGTEFRYLSPRHAGEFDVQYLPDDDRLGTHRSYASWRHGSRLNDWLRADVDLRHVSDERFFEDFGNSLQASSISFLRSRAALTARGDWWTGSFILDAFETVDRDIRPQNEPYDRLPRLVFGGARSLAGGPLQFRLGAEYASFDRDTGIDGGRLDLYPQLQWPIYRPAGYLMPSLGVRFTQYDLDSGADTVADDQPSRTTPIASVEGGLVFERPLAGGGIQTLEPRVHYLYVPFETQDDLPTFDSAELSFGFNQLFRTNRFSGADRQGDANQLSLALTTRWLEAGSGRQRLEASLGTIVYFRDQTVQLDASARQDADTSPLVAEISYRPTDRWQVALGFQWDPEDHEFDQGLMDLRYRGRQGQLFNLAYRLRGERVEQVDLSFLWPLNERWSLVGRHNPSLLDGTALESLLGFEYRSCCWALRMMGRRFVRTQDGDKRDALYLELELIGLGSLGRSTAGILERAILGYRAGDNRYRN